MNIIYVQFKKINIRNYITKENTAVFETFVDDNYEKRIIRPRLNINSASLGVIKSVIRAEEKIHSKIGDEAKIVIQDKDLVKKAVKDFVEKLREITLTMDKKDPSKYLDALSKINRMSLNFDKEIERLKNGKETNTKTEDWRERLRLTRLRLKKKENEK